MPILVSKQFTDFNSIEDNNEGSEIDTISVRINGASSVSSTFFEEHLDLVSEVLSFLDVKSLLTVCQTTKVFSSCLRHEHVVASALSTPSSLTSTSTQSSFFPEVPTSLFTSTNEAKKLYLPTNSIDVMYHHHTQHRQHMREAAITTRLLKVFEDYDNIRSSQKSDALNKAMGHTSYPSPVRLLRLVNGKKCERCNRKLSPFTGGHNIVLPSLTFAKFCCTQCIFK
mmetsp:Transcript_19452/g.40060  ORF Transcript_19452/g.40060 Transcript_19452/m.40060 type:complete len:226 (+) Transcript_19452:107-784(+)|eukprot:CAMPEP_0201217858 /NCGR_PEP_ID=MMETSP0851-20130426/190280_1 /ASSEMBLY_ACC=CAM_ASM_000631 /TAXON_ID=183588 /ORGANISM="Pseudo-nitzschia fraudulenta, Strain WWA7" /LENGTH=225 /DNA_ID=CAMNT_0047507529 /DNA_START=274 /DNA_END=951 /DNA_ORIENTATION=+